MPHWQDIGGQKLSGRVRSKLAYGSNETFETVEGDWQEIQFDVTNDDDVTLEGDWYNADVGRNWDELFEDAASDWVSTTFTLVDAGTEDNAPEFTYTPVTDLPFITGTLTDDGPVAGLTLTFRITEVNGNAVNIVDGTTETDELGQFAYAFSSYTPGVANTFEIDVEESRYEDDFDTTTATLAGGSATFTPTSFGSLIVDEFALAEPTGENGNGDPLAIVPSVVGSISTGDNVALVEVEFDFNGDGTPDASTLTDGLGEFEFTPTNLSSLSGSTGTFAARVANQQTYVDASSTPIGASHPSRTPHFRPTPEVPPLDGGTSVTKIVTYTYDAANNWISRTVDTDGDGNPNERAVYVHDGGNMVLELEGDVALPTDELTKDDLSHRYLWGPGRNQLLADEAIASLTDTSQNDVLYALTDHLGTVRDLMDENLPRP